MMDLIWIPAFEVVS